jgi:15-cis-phytoene synthase
MFNVYAFCREIDDIVDENQDYQLALHNLNWWRQELRRAYLGQATHMVAKALHTSIQHYPLKKEWFETIIDGMEQDLTQTTYADFTNLEQYCWRVAGVVGVISAHVFGFKNTQTIQYAKKMGLALQLINIIRDIAEDAARGRTYLPLAELQTYQVQIHELNYISTQKSVNKNMQNDAAYNERFIKLMAHQAQRACDIYQDAINTLPEEDKQAQKSGLIMGAIYRRLLDEIIESNYQVLHQRIQLQPLHKLWIASKTWLNI